MNGQDVRTPEGAKLHNDREWLIKALEGKGKGGEWGQSLQTVGSRALFGGAITALININLLISGDILAYVTAVASGTAVSALSTGATELLKSTPMSDFAGPIVAAGMVTLFNTYSLVKTGDWARFGKDMAVGGLSTGAGVGCAYGAGALLAGTGVGAPLAFVIVCGASLVGSGGTRWLVGKVPFFGRATAFEIHQEKEMRARMAKVNKELESTGLILDDSTPQQFADMLRHGMLKVKKHDWSALATGTAKANLADGAYKQCIRVIFSVAKVRSPSGDIASGLKLLLDDLSRL